MSPLKNKPDSKNSAVTSKVGHRIVVITNRRVKILFIIKEFREKNRAVTSKVGHRNGGWRGKCSLLGVEADCVRSAGNLHSNRNHLLIEMRRLNLECVILHLNAISLPVSNILSCNIETKWQFDVRESHKVVSWNFYYSYLFCLIFDKFVSLCLHSNFTSLRSLKLSFICIGLRSIYWLILINPFVTE